MSKQGRTPPSWARHLAYWVHRAKEYPGEYVAHRNKGALRQASTILAFTRGLIDLGAPYEQAVDFGCGPGRFTPFLGLRCRRILGVDILPKDMLGYPGQEPPPACQYAYQQLAFPPRIGLPDDSADFLWSCLALQHIVQDELLEPICAELRRVLAPGANVVLVELAHATAPHCASRRPDEYARLLNLQDNWIAKAAFLDEDGPPHHIICGAEKKEKDHAR